MSPFAPFDEEAAIAVVDELNTSDGDDPADYESASSSPVPITLVRRTLRTSPARHFISRGGGSAAHSQGSG